MSYSRCAQTVARRRTRGSLIALVMATHTLLEFPDPLRKKAKCYGHSQKNPPPTAQHIPIKHLNPIKCTYHMSFYTHHG